MRRNKRYGIFKKGGRIPKYNLGNIFKKTSKDLATPSFKLAASFDKLPKPVIEGIQQGIDEGVDFLQRRYLTPSKQSLHPEFMKRFFNTTDGLQSLIIPAPAMTSADLQKSLRYKDTPFIDMTDTAFDKGYWTFDEFLSKHHKVSDRELPGIKQAFYNPEDIASRNALTDSGRQSLDLLKAQAQYENNRLHKLFSDLSDPSKFNERIQFRSRKDDLLNLGTSVFPGKGVVGGALATDKISPGVQETWKAVLPIYNTLKAKMPHSLAMAKLKKNLPPELHPAIEFLPFIDFNSSLPSSAGRVYMNLDRLTLENLSPLTATTLAHEIGAHLKRLKYTANPRLDLADAIPRHQALDIMDLNRVNYLTDPVEVDAGFLELARMQDKYTKDPWKKFDPSSFKSVLALDHTVTPQTYPSTRSLVELGILGEQLYSLASPKNSKEVNQKLLNHYLQTYNKMYTTGGELK